MSETTIAPAMGRAMNRRDGHLKVTGRAKYAGDFPVKNLLYGVIFGSEIASGKISDIDMEAARRVPGVIEIMTYKNAPKVKLPKGDQGAGTGESFVPLQDAKIFYNGQHVGVVIAETLEAAHQAAKLVKVRYSAGASKLNLEQSLKDAYVMSKMPPIGPINAVTGNTEKALKESSVKIDQVYTTPIENHNPMEPSGTVADWSGDQLMVYDSTQGVASMADILAKAFKIDKSKVHVITKFVGGAFGCKGSCWPHQFLAVMASKLVKRPVKLLLTREQMFTGVGHRAKTIQPVTLGASREGKLLAIEHTCINNTALNKDYSERSAVATPMLYKCDNIKAVHKVVKLNYQVPTFMRAPGEVSGAFALESALDELSYELNIDPIQLRVQNYAQKDEHEHLPFSSKSLLQCYEQAAKKFDWSRRLARPGAIRDGDYLIGYGMATSTYPAKRFAATASIDLFNNGKVKVRSATQDLGTGSYTIFPQVAADRLAVDIDRVDFDLGDSKYPKSSVSGGSTTAASVGTAINAACESIKNQMVKLAVADASSPLYQADVGQITFSNARIHLKENLKKGESYVDLMTRNKVELLSAVGENPMSPPKPPTFSTHSFGAQFSEVRVHRLTGEVRIVKHVGAFACGKIINPKTTRSQYLGGIIMGFGMGLMEETRSDLRTGRLTVKDLADYHVPIQADIPSIDVIMVEEADSNVNPIGVKGVGEIGIVGVAPAIANAVYNATGLRIRDLPITPDKIIMAQIARG